MARSLSSVDILDGHILSTLPRNHCDRSGQSCALVLVGDLECIRQLALHHLDVAYIVFLHQGVLSSHRRNNGLSVGVHGLDLGNTVGDSDSLTANLFRLQNNWHDVLLNRIHLQNLSSRSQSVVVDNSNEFLGADLVVESRLDDFSKLLDDGGAGSFPLEYLVFLNEGSL